MALSGSIKEFGLAEVFQLIFHQKKEGNLILSRAEEKVTVLFKEGKIIRADEGPCDKIFGEKLLKAGILTDDQIAISGYRQESKRKSFEAVLVELGFILPEEIQRLSRLFTEETVFALFQWASGDYLFEQREVTYSPTLIQPLDTQFLLMEAIRQIDEWPFLLKDIPSRKTIFEQTKGSKAEASKTKDLAPEREDSFESLEESEGDEDLDWILEQIDGERTVQQIINQAHMGSFLVYQGLKALLSENKIKKVFHEENQKKRRSFSEKGTLLKYAFNTAVILLAVGIFIFSYSSVRTISIRAERSFKELKKLSAKNEAYFIRFGLDLYYLKYSRYPVALRLLAEEGFLGTEMNLVDHLANWSYELDSENSDKFLLKKRS